MKSIGQRFNPNTAAKQSRDRQARHAEDRTPVVYFAIAAGANLVKIGSVTRQSRVQQRLEELQCGCPYTLIVGALVKGATRSEELRLHKLFDRYRLAREWFHCEGELKTFLQHAAVDEDLATATILAKIRKPLTFDN